MEDKTLLEKIADLEAKVADIEAASQKPHQKPHLIKQIFGRIFYSKLILSSTFFILILSSVIYAVTIYKPHQFFDGQTASASEVNDNFDVLYQYVNSAFNHAFPDGMRGTVVNKLIGPGTPYTVPTGSTLYITSIHNSAGTNDLQISSTVFYTFTTTSTAQLNLPLVFGENTSIEPTGNSMYFTGIEVPRQVDVVNVTIDSTTGYTIPANTALYILSIYSDVALDLQDDGNTIITCSATSNCFNTSGVPIILYGETSGNQILTSAGTAAITGYQVYDYM